MSEAVCTCPEGARVWDALDCPVCGEAANAAARAQSWPRVIEHLSVRADREEEAALPV